MLSVEKENRGGDVTDVKVSCIDRSFVYINDIDGRHITQVMGSFWELELTEMKDELSLRKHDTKSNRRN